jgi:hypothetical protein
VLSKVILAYALHKEPTVTAVGLRCFGFYIIKNSGFFFQVGLRVPVIFLLE